MGHAWKIGVTSVKAKALISNYNTIFCGSLAITKVRTRIKTTSGIGLECDPGCTSSCEEYDPANPFVGCFIRYY